MKYVLGIDPGLTGAFAYLVDGILVSAFDMPTHKNANGKTEVDAQKLGLFLDTLSRVDLAVIEEVGVMSGKEGRVSMFNFGKSTGMVHGALGAFGIPIFETKPAVWKSAMGLTSNKATSIKMATECFGDSFWPFKKHHGRAEAALLGLFGWRNFK